jgi:hypothetical protein
MLASSGGHASVVELLLSKGADIPNDKDDNGDSPIMWVSEKGHVNIVELLLSKGASPNDKDNNGDSPIMLASSVGHASIVELLLSKGADIPNLESYYSLIIKDILDKWPISMAIIVLQELSLYYHLDASTIIDLYQYIGALEEDNEEDEEESDDDFDDDDFDDDDFEGVNIPKARRTTEKPALGSVFPIVCLGNSTSVLVFMMLFLSFWSIHFRQAELKVRCKKWLLFCFLPEFWIV